MHDPAPSQPHTPARRAGLSTALLIGVAAASLAAAAPAESSLEPAEKQLVLLPGASATLKVSVARRGGLSGSLKLQALALPQGVSAAAGPIAADGKETVLRLSASPTAPHSLPTTTLLRAIAESTADAKATSIAAEAPLTITVRGAPGSVDGSFAGGQGRQLVAMGPTDAYPTAMALQADGKPILVGNGFAKGGRDFALLRFTRDGQLDPSFGSGGRVYSAVGPGSATDQAHAVALQPDGKIVVAGSTDAGPGRGLDFAVLRYLPDGRLDENFGDRGKVVAQLGGDVDIARSLLILRDGRIVVGGESNASALVSGSDFALLRLEPDGRIDASFGKGGKALTAIKAHTGKDALYQLALQEIKGQAPRLIAAGGEGDFVLAAYTLDGQLDPGFGSGGKTVGLFNAAIGAARALLVLPDGRLLLAGHIGHHFALARLSADGQLDSGFGQGGRMIRAVGSSDTWDEASAMARLPDGKLLVAGWINEDGSSSPDFVTLRLLEDGQLDASYAQAGIARTPMSQPRRPDAARALLLQPDDRVPTLRALVGGEASADGAYRFGLFRLWQ